MSHGEKNGFRERSRKAPKGVEGIKNLGKKSKGGMEYGKRSRREKEFPERRGGSEGINPSGKAVKGRKKLLNGI